MSEKKWIHLLMLQVTLSCYHLEIKGSEEIVLDEIRIPSKSTRGIIGKIKSVRYPTGKNGANLNAEDLIELEVEITDYELLGLN